MMMTVEKSYGLILFLILFLFLFIHTFTQQFNAFLLFTIYHWLGIEQRPIYYIQVTLVVKLIFFLISKCKIIENRSDYLGAIKVNNFTCFTYCIEQIR